MIQRDHDGADNMDESEEGHGYLDEAGYAADDPDYDDFDYDDYVEREFGRPAPGASWIFGRGTTARVATIAMVLLLLIAFLLATFS